MDLNSEWWNAAELLFEAPTVTSPYNAECTMTFFPTLLLPSMTYLPTYHLAPVSRIRNPYNFIIVLLTVKKK